MAGKGIADAADPVGEDAYWRDQHVTRPYANGSDYDEYRPAYVYGVDAHTRYPGRIFDDVEPELGRDWNRAKHATRDAWQRVSDAAERAAPGDSDRDGK